MTSSFYSYNTHLCLINHYLLTYEAIAREHDANSSIVSLSYLIVRGYPLATHHHTQSYYEGTKSIQFI